jgi:hypothetical protein
MRKRGIERMDSEPGSLMWVRGAVSIATTRRDDWIGDAGLWRATQIEDRVVSAFSCPSVASLARFGLLDEREAPRLEQEIEAWAQATSRRMLPKEWQAPEAQVASSWLAPDKLAVRAGSQVAKGELECDPEHLRVSFPQVVRLDQGLSPERQEWMRALCLDAQLRWQLVRFGIVEDCVHAEVDLSGVPADLAEPLFRVAVEALVFAVGWALPGLALVADPSAKSAVLDRQPWWLLEKQAVAG